MPFHFTPLYASPLLQDASKFPLCLSAFHSKRKECAYKGRVCSTSLREPYCCRCRGPGHDRIAPLREDNAQLPPGRAGERGGLAWLWEKGFSCISMFIEL